MGCMVKATFILLASHQTPDSRGKAPVGDGSLLQTIRSRVTPRRVFPFIDVVSRG
jgi:hypothetical protein